MNPPQNFNNDNPQENASYSKLLINHELSLQQNGQLGPNHNQQINQQQAYQPQQQPYQQPEQNQQPYQQPQEQPLQANQQPLIFLQQQYPNQYNQVVPNLEQLIDQNNGQNVGQNRKFGICVTFIWAIQMQLDFFFLYFTRHYTIPYYLGVICVVFMILIPFIVFKMNENQSTAISILLFLIFIITSTGTSKGLFDQIGELYGYQILFQYFQFGTMTFAFLYLQKFHNRLEEKQILRLTRIIIVVNQLYIIWQLKAFYFYRLMAYLVFNIIVWYSFCSTISHMLVNTLERIYKGQNKKIQKDNLWTGYILFKLYFFLPELKRYEN